VITSVGGVQRQALPADAAADAGPQPLIRRGTGQVIIATIPTGAPQAGVLVPRSALIMGESDSWAYLKTKADTYLRTRIDTSRPEGDGYFITEGLKPGQEVVTAGAGQLYAREINPATEPAD
jgi:hypothetical protein